jgi:hypothetical protein
MKIPVLNDRGININLVHFQGTSIDDYKKTTNLIYKHIDLDNQYIQYQFHKNNL